MKVFVASGPGEKKRLDDFSCTVDGELVSLPLDGCDCVDCGCERAVAGLGSSKGTTTFAVLDKPELDAAGSRSDVAWLEVRDKDGNVLPGLTIGPDATGDAEIVDGGNIVVPHASSGGRKK